MESLQPSEMQAVVTLVMTEMGEAGRELLKPHMLSQVGQPFAFHSCGWQHLLLSVMQTLIFIIPHTIQQSPRLFWSLVRHYGVGTSVCARDHMCKLLSIVWCQCVGKFCL